jgi:2-haloacid dehalogenase
MTLNRRQFWNLAAGSVATGLLGTGRVARAETSPAIEAIAFDGFTIFDRPISAPAEKLFPGRGADLSNAWRTRQFEHTWLRTVCRRYADF